jgi:hypothetical protein
MTTRRSDLAGVVCNGYSRGAPNKEGNDQGPAKEPLRTVLEPVVDISGPGVEAAMACLPLPWSSYFDGTRDQRRDRRSFVWPQRLVILTVAKGGDPVESPPSS